MIPRNAAKLEDRLHNRTEGRSLSGKRDRAFTFKFCLDHHLPLVSSGLLQNICLQESGSLAES